jgi:hypothetical protein
MLAICKNDGWYWQENDVQYGPYTKLESLQLEQFCLVGSLKYAMLKTGKLTPRRGDFVRDTSGLVIGHFQQACKVGKVPGYLVEDANGHPCFIAEGDLIWIAPFEWALEEGT